MAIPNIRTIFGFSRDNRDIREKGYRESPKIQGISVGL